MACRHFGNILSGVVINALIYGSPVSYTHLDVYKRQVRGGETIGASLMELPFVYFGRSVAVSYTHLDVYKRQVTGTVHPDRIWQNNTGRVGDLLILTKPLGTGILCAAHRVGEENPGGFQKRCV